MIRRSHYLGLILLLCLIGLMIAVLVVRSPEDSRRYEISAPMPQWRDVSTGFLPEHTAWVKPLVRATACIFAFRAVRYSLEPAKVGFDGCGDKVSVTIDDNYYEVTVSGIAMVDGRPRPFTATLNHYPPSTSETGFIATGIKIGD